MTKQEKLAFFKEEMKKTYEQMDNLTQDCLVMAKQANTPASRVFGTDYTVQLLGGLGLVAGSIALIADCLNTMMEE